MSNDSFTPAPALALTTHEQIRAYVHPTRITILAMLAAEPQTITGVARQLGVHPANITHHFRQLEKAELIRLVEKRETGRNLEKYYRAAAYHFTVSPPEGKPASQGILALAILRDNLTAAIQALKAKENNDETNIAVLGLLTTARLRQKDLVRFVTRLQEVRQEFSALHAETGEMYNLNISLYPGEKESPPKQEIFIGNGG